MRLHPQLLSRSFVRASSSSAGAPSLIRARTVAAPHCGTIRVLGLHNPGTRNAISRALLGELRAHVSEIQAEGAGGATRALVLASEIDESFCAGADLKERKTFTPQDVEAFLAGLRGVLADLESLSIPTISAVSSLALGGGLELALATHLRVFASTATVGLPETRLGIIPGAGGTFRLPAVIGRTRALDLMLTGRRVAGPEAYFMGLCDRLVEVAEDERKAPGVARQKVLEATLELARTVCEGGPLALRAVLECAGRGPEAEGRAYDGLMDSTDRTEALRAFAEKRKPVYTGR